MACPPKAAVAAAVVVASAAGRAQEPLPEDSPLWDAPNMWISPHVSAESVQLIERRKAIFKENLRRYLAAEELLHVCDTEKGY